MEKGPIQGFIDMVTALKNLVGACNRINQTLTDLLPGGLAIVDVQGTVTPSGTTGDVTINKPGGTVNFAAAATSLTVTNSLVTANSFVIAMVRNIDATMKYVTAVPGSGSFVLTANAAPTAETSVGFIVVNFT